MKNVIYLLLLLSTSLCAESMPIEEQNIVNSIDTKEISANPSLDALIEDMKGSPSSSKLYLSEIESYAYQVVNNLLMPYGFTFDTISSYLRGLITNIVNNITFQRTTQAQRNNQKFVDKSVIIADVTKQVTPLIKNLSTQINAINVAMYIDNAFVDLCTDKDLDIDQIPASMLTELATLKKQVKTKALTLINNNINDQISYYDLQQLVVSTLSGFVSRVQYVLMMEWSTKVIELNSATRGTKPSSYLTETPETQELFESMRFLKKHYATPTKKK